MTSIYLRDMIGYGAEPPHAQWPGGARIALQFVINYEEGAENSILHGDTAAEAFLSEWIGALPTFGMRNMNMESLYEYGSRAGFWRLSIRRWWRRWSPPAGRWQRTVIGGSTITLEISSQPTLRWREMDSNRRSPAEFSRTGSRSP